MDGATSAQNPKNEVLEVEDEDARSRRLHGMMERLDAAASTQPSPSTFLISERDTPHHIEPNHELLDRLKAFLPEIEESNARLAQTAREDPESVNMESIDNTTDGYIRMTLGLGVFEDRYNVSNSSQEDETMDTSSESDSTSSDEDSSSDYDSDSSSDVVSSVFPARPVKPLPKRAVQDQRDALIVDLDAPSSTEESTQSR